MTGFKSRLGPVAQKHLVSWIDEALGPRKRGGFVALFKITAFGQTTFNRNVGASGKFTEEQARTICQAIDRPFDKLSPAAPAKNAAQATCDYRCQLFHVINAGTCTDPTQAEARKLATQRLKGQFKIVYRFVSGEDRDYGVEFKLCPCGATLFEYIKDVDRRPLARLGFALCVGDMLSIYMIGSGLHWTLACNVPRQVDNRALTGIILDPNAKTSQVEANKFVLIKSGTAVAADLTDSDIADLLNNKPSVPDGTLVSMRE